MNFFEFILILSIISTPSAAANPVVRSRYLMGTLCEITAHGPGASDGITAAFDEIARLEGVMSHYRHDSELSRLVRAGEAAVSGDLWAVLQRTLEVSAASDGLFDPTYSSPSSARGWRRVRMEPARRAVGLAPGARLDLGGVGKGYALDAAARALRARGVRSALINFGGQVHALGSPPGAPAWPVDLPPFLSFELVDASVSTSGDAERPGHIRDARTGAAVRKTSSVTVIAPTATEADAWDTALYLSGLNRPPRAFTACAIETSPGKAPVFAGDCARYRTSPWGTASKRRPNT